MAAKKRKRRSKSSAKAKPEDERDFDDPVPLLDPDDIPPDIARDLVCVPADEPPREAVTQIARDAVTILRHELAYRAALSRAHPGLVSLGDATALLRLATELGNAASRGEDEATQSADYSRLTPEERVQLATLLLKVDYA